MTKTYQRVTARHLILSILLVATLAACGAGGPSGAEQGPDDTGGPAGPAGLGQPGAPGGDAASTVAVATVRASLGPIQKTLQVGGEVVAEHQVEVFADIAGKVVTLPVSLGDSVRKEQVIAKVDPSKPGKEYAESPVLAPISGTVTALPIRVGSTITSSTPIATIGQLNALRIETHIPERFISKVQVGTPASFTFAAWPGESFSGRVVELSPVVDSASRTLKATLVLDSQDGGVRAGMYATVQLVTERRHAVLRIPAECVVRRNGQGAQDVVFVLQDNRAVQRPVRIGISSGGMVEITAGIESGEEVVVSGQSLLSDGAAVKIIDDEQTGGGA